MSKVTILKINRTPKTSKDGKPYTSMGLIVDNSEYKDRWINGFGGKENADWKAGDEIDITIKEVAINGKTYLNFEIPKAPKSDNKQVMTELLLIRQNTEKIIKHLRGEERLDQTSDGSPFPKF